MTCNIKDFLRENTVQIFFSKINCSNIVDDNFPGR